METTCCLPRPRQQGASPDEAGPTPPSACRPARGLWLAGIGLFSLALAELWLRLRHRQAELRWAEPGLRRETRELDARALSSGPCIVALGDSITHGMELPVESTYPYLLQQKLRASRPDQAVSVVNAGIAGQTVVQAIQRLRRDVIRYRPDLTLIAFGLNDASLRCRPQDARRERDICPKGVAGVLNRFHLYRTLRARGRELATRLGFLAPIDYDAPPVCEARTSPDAFRWALAEMARRIARQGGGRTSLMTMHVVDAHPASPVPGQDGHGEGDGAGRRQRELRARYNDMVRQVAREQGIGLIDVERDMERAALRDGGHRLFTDDGIHLTAHGQSILAQIVFDAMLEDGTWSGRAQRQRRAAHEIVSSSSCREM